MATRTKSEFEALYGTSGTIFPDNTTGDITAEDQRNFGQDIADTFNIGGGGGGGVSDSAFSTSWNGDTTNAPSKNAVYDMVAGLQSKVITIGDWDMDSTNDVSIAHGLDSTKIASVSVLIFDDVGLKYSLFGGYDNTNFNVDGAMVVSSTNITLYRKTSGFFDSASFNATSYNRGRIVIQYVV